MRALLFVTALTISCVPAAAFANGTAGVREAAGTGKTAGAIKMSAAKKTAGGTKPAATKSSAATATASTVSPILGRWQLDLTSMPGDYGTKPKSVTYQFSDDGDGRWTTTIDITAPDDSVRHMVSHFSRDGKAVAIEGDQMEADAVAASLPAPQTLVMGLSKGGRPGSVRVYSVSPSGNEMTESAVNVDDEGKPFVRSFRFTRIGG